MLLNFNESFHRGLVYLLGHKYEVKKSVYLIFSGTPCINIGLTKEN